MRYSPDVRIHEVGVGHLGVVEVLADGLLGDLVGGLTPSSTSARTASMISARPP